MKKSVKGKFTTVKSLVVVTGYGSFCCTDHQSELPSQYIHRFCLTHFSLPRLMVLGHIVYWLNQNVESPSYFQVLNHRIRIQAFESLSCRRIFISKDISNLAKHNFCLCQQTHQVSKAALRNERETLEITIPFDPVTSQFLPSSVDFVVGNPYSLVGKQGAIRK